MEQNIMKSTRSKGKESNGNAISCLKRMSDRKIGVIGTICGILGLALTIAIFFYTGNIDERQKVMERVEREKELAEFADKNMLSHIMLLKEKSGLLPEGSKKDVILKIISFEVSFYKLSYLYDKTLIDEIYFTQKTDFSDSLYVCNLQEYFTYSQTVINMPDDIVNDIIKTEWVQDQDFRNMLAAYLKNIHPYRKSMSCSLNKSLELLYTHTNSKQLDVNKLSKDIEKVHATYSIVRYLRKELNFFDYLVMTKILND